MHEFLGPSPDPGAVKLVVLIRSCCSRICRDYEGGAGLGYHPPLHPLLVELTNSIYYYRVKQQPALGNAHNTLCPFPCAFSPI